MIQEKACGIIVFDEKNRVLIVKHNKGHYGFPKGHVEENESEEETALREVKEETNCDVDIIPNSRLNPIHYSPKEGVMKEVVFFVGRPINKDIIPQEEELSFAGFVPVKEAFELVSVFKDEVGLLEEAVSFIEKENNK